MLRFLTLIALLVPTVLPAARTAVIGRIVLTQDYEYNGKIGVRIDVYDVKVTGMKGRQVHFGFNLFQKKWLNQWVGLEAEDVDTEIREWKGQVAWFFFNYELLQKTAAGKEPLKGVFFVVDTATGKDIGKKEVAIPVPEKEEPSRTDSSDGAGLTGIWSGGCWMEKAPPSTFVFRADGSVEVEYKLKKYNGRYTSEGGTVKLEFAEESLPGVLTLSGSSELKDNKCWSLKRQ